MAPIVAGLLKAGLTLVGNAVLAKGRQWVEDKAGVKLADEVTPEALTRLRQFELEHEEELQRLRVEDNRIDAELEKAYLADTQSARDRDKEFIKTGRKNERADNLAYMAVGGFLAIAFLVFLTPALLGYKIDQTVKEVLLYVLGVLNTIVVMIFSFEFGTSKDAAKMQNAMKDWLDQS